MECKEDIEKSKLDELIRWNITRLECKEKYILDAMIETGLLEYNQIGM